MIASLFQGYMFTLNGVVSWKSSKQQTVVNSTIELEYIVVSEATKEAIWMKKFITKLDVVLEIEQPVSVYYDNTGVITQAKEPRSHHKSKHTVRRFHLVQEIIERSDIIIE